ncbi:snakin-2-like, partial [Fagus crenata]
CGGLCKQRCSLHSRPNLCNRACGTCCVRCKCVPPGTAGNRELCGACYTEMTTHGNKTKCP